MRSLNQTQSQLSCSPGPSTLSCPQSCLSPVCRVPRRESPRHGFPRRWTRRRPRRRPPPPCSSTVDPCHQSLLDELEVQQVQRSSQWFFHDGCSSSSPDHLQARHTPTPEPQLIINSDSIATPNILIKLELCSTCKPPELTGNSLTARSADSTFSNSTKAQTFCCRCG